MTVLQIALLASAALAASGAFVAMRFVAVAKEADSEFGVLDDDEQADTT